MRQEEVSIKYLERPSFETPRIVFEAWAMLVFVVVAYGGCEAVICVYGVAGALAKRPYSDIST